MQPVTYLLSADQAAGRAPFDPTGTAPPPATLPSRRAYQQMLFAPDGSQLAALEQRADGCLVDVWNLRAPQLASLRYAKLPADGALCVAGAPAALALASPSKGGRLQLEAPDPAGRPPERGTCVAAAAAGRGASLFVPDPQMAHARHFVLAMDSAAHAARTVRQRSFGPLSTRFPAPMTSLTAEDPAGQWRAGLHGNCLTVDRLDTPQAEGLRRYPLRALGDRKTVLLWFSARYLHGISEASDGSQSDVWQVPRVSLARGGAWAADMTDHFPFRLQHPSHDAKGRFVAATAAGGGEGHGRPLLLDFAARKPRLFWLDVGAYHSYPSSTLKFCDQARKLLVATRHFTGMQIRLFDLPGTPGPTPGDSLLRTVARKLPVDDMTELAICGMGRRLAISSAYAHEAKVMVWDTDALVPLDQRVQAGLRALASDLHGELPADVLGDGVDTWSALWSDAECDGEVAIAAYHAEEADDPLAW